MWQKWQRGISTCRGRGALLIAPVIAVGVVMATWSAPASAGVVRVARGATLDGLAASLGVSPGSLAAANHLSNPDLILAGTTLVVPSGSSTSTGSGGAVTLTAGETLWSLSRQWGTTVTAIADANGISNPNQIFAGAQLRIPGSAGASASPAMEDTADVTPAVSPTGGTFPARLLAHPDRMALVPAFQRWAGTFGIPSSLLEAMCWWESGWQSSISSSTGAIGIGQLEPATVALMRARLGIPALDPWVPSDNIEMSAGFLAGLVRQAGGSAATALAYYYQGAKSVNQMGMFPFTRVYVQGILATVNAYSW
jgi:LysM repeat protein